MRERRGGRGYRQEGGWRDIEEVWGGEREDRWMRWEKREGVAEKRG